MDFKKTEEQELLLESLKTVMERGDFENYFKECDKNHEYPQKLSLIHICWLAYPKNVWLSQGPYSPVHIDPS